MYAQASCRGFHLQTYTYICVFNHMHGCIRMYAGRMYINRWVLQMHVLGVEEGCSAGMCVVSDGS